MKKYVAIIGVVLGLGLTAFALPEEKIEPYFEPNEVNDPSYCDVVPGNLATNCGFETGTLAGWTQFGDTSFTGVQGGEVAHSGNFGLFSGPVSTLGGIFQNITTVPGQTYQLIFYLRNMQTPNMFRVSWGGAVVYSCDNCPNFPYMGIGIYPLMATGTSTELRFSFFNVPDFFYLDDVIVLFCPQGPVFFPNE
jgi:hypothetical protein